METKKDFHEEQKKPEEIKKEGVEKKKNCFCKSKNFPLGFGIGVFAMGIISVALISLILIPIVKDKEAANNGLGLEEAKVKTEKFINDILIGDKGDKITVKDASEENGMYKIVVTTTQGQDVETYLTKDGKLFFDRTMNIEEVEKEIQTSKDGEAATPKEAVKSDKPNVELFVMSHCPYGTQIEKGILPAAEALGDKIDFEIKFVNYAMHGEIELNEELKQHCIKTEESAKFTSYLKCFLEDGNSDRCSKQANINVSKINSCVSATDKKFSVKENFADKATYKGNYPPFNIYKEDNAKYAVSGSPTLVINGTTVESGRDSASLLAKICSAFNTAPAECSTELSSAQPAPGFGVGASTSAGSDASCQ
jgi:hypothetical protein